MKGYVQHGVEEEKKKYRKTWMCSRAVELDSNGLDCTGLLCSFFSVVLLFRSVQNARPCRLLLFEGDNEVRTWITPRVLLYVPGKNFSRGKKKQKNFTIWISSCAAKLWNKLQFCFPCGMKAAICIVNKHSTVVYLLFAFSHWFEWQLKRETKKIAKLTDDT